MHEYPLPIDKMPCDDRSYCTPTLDYSTPAKNEPGKWAIDSDMVMVDLSHPWGNDQPTWPAGAQPYTTPVQYMSKFNRRTQLMYGFPQHVSHALRRPVARLPGEPLQRRSGPREVHRSGGHLGRPLQAHGDHHPRDAGEVQAQAAARRLRHHHHRLAPPLQRLRPLLPLEPRSERGRRRVAGGAGRVRFRHRHPGSRPPLRVLHGRPRPRSAGAPRDRSVREHLLPRAQAPRKTIPSGSRSTRSSSSATSPPGRTSAATSTRCSASAAWSAPSRRAGTWATAPSCGWWPSSTRTS